MNEEKTESSEEFLFRLNRKKNFKNEEAWEYTIRGNTLEEIKQRDKEMKEYLEGSK